MRGIVAWSPEDVRTLKRGCRDGGGEEVEVYALGQGIRIATGCGNGRTCGRRVGVASLIRRCRARAGMRDQPGHRRKAAAAGSGVGVVGDCGVPGI
jgi:hypothetical protein